MELWATPRQRQHSTSRMTPNIRDVDQKNYPPSEKHKSQGLGCFLCMFNGCFDFTFPTFIPNHFLSSATCLVFSCSQAGFQHLNLRLLQFHDRLQLCHLQGGRELKREAKSGRFSWRSVSLYTQNLAFKKTNSMFLDKLAMPSSPVALVPLVPLPAGSGIWFLSSKSWSKLPRIKVSAPLILLVFIPSKGKEASMDATLEFTRTVCSSDFRESKDELLEEQASPSQVVPLPTTTPWRKNWSQRIMAHGRSEKMYSNKREAALSNRKRSKWTAKNSKLFSYSSWITAVTSWINKKLNTNQWINVESSTFFKSPKLPKQPWSTLIIKPFMSRKFLAWLQDAIRLPPKGWEM